MMRKTVLLLLAASLLLACAACVQSGKGSFGQKDLYLNVHGTKITADMPVDQILAAFGTDYEYAEAISCVYEGMDRTYTYDDAVLYTYPDGNTERLMELSCSGAETTASRGIAPGASSADVIAAYGTPTRQTGSILSYELKPSSPENEPASLYFLIRNDRVESISITADHRAE